MQSSYNSNLNFGDILETITFLKNPTQIIEFGILDGFSLTKFIKNSSANCVIDAYDIFDDFNGNHSNKNIINEYDMYKNVSIKYGDFYKCCKNIPDNSIDILHVDIANNGDTYKFVFENYITKMNKKGIIIMEGGSYERDNVEWMTRYSKPKIQPVLKLYAEKYNIHVIEAFPSMTIVRL
jgi:predicted O-methyltransferase YrrM